MKNWYHIFFYFGQYKIFSSDLKKKTIVFIQKRSDANTYHDLGNPL